MIWDLLIAALLVISGLFGLIGAFGLLKLRAPMQRLHAPTKATTVGVGAALLASAGTAVLVGDAPWQEAMVAVFLFLTAPLTALYLAKAHLHGTVDRKGLPPTGTGSDWAGFTPPPQE
ncbi:MAG: Na+/H+ antiporter subunit G [Rhodobacterales bacterium RIFCSPHIGHO2_02_FULL_62_130]|jgi:multicomponent K+:H+ antiporter subunit G|nr:MAG: Na+/H+ antiporter subunit G [Rhodobacterales bacterium RIFCSPHIGHO2_02_FULL_62_130]OHC60935.1 MAG: Na+/H+ antiporter subunit G [Rhodobacterales bacterium RIFCSPHIGHO2_12_FULL_62_75]HCY99234.1 Na+/H+ antiporter subunit G [Rhodobacter sp.]